MLANGTRNANGYFVRNANWNSLADLDRLLLAHWYAYGVGNLAANVFANIAAHGVGLSLALRNHGAGRVANVFGALFANPIGYAVVDSASAALRNHTASGVVYRAAAWLADNAASRVVHSALTALWHHTASRVVDGAATWFADGAANIVAYRAATALRNHAACRVVDGAASALRNHLANGVRNRFCYAATLVTCAIDFLRFAGWNPNLLANGARWALYAFDVARTWAVNATALRCIPHPRTWRTYNATLYRTSDFFRYGIPMATANLHCACVVDGFGDVANDFASTCFLLRNHDRVVDYAAVALFHWGHNRVVDDSFSSFHNRLTNRVVDNLAVGLVYRRHDRVVDDLTVGLIDRLFDRVVDDLAVGFVHRLADRVVDLTCAGLSYRTAYVVGYLTSLSRIYRSIDRVGPSLGLVNRLAHNGINRAVTRFTLHPSHIDYLVFGNRLVLSACSLLGLLLVNRSANRFHHSVRGGPTAICDYTSAAIITRRAAISGVGLARRECY